MKKILIAVIAFLSLSIAYAQLNKNLPGSVQLFLDEMEFSRQSSSSSVNLGTSPVQHNSRFAPPRLVDGTLMIDAFIGIDSEEVIEQLRAAGVKVDCLFGDFVTARIPVDQLTQISQIQGVNDVELSGLLEPCTDSTLRVTHAGELLKGREAGLPTIYDGRGVIIGIIDGGFDYQHIAFKSADDPSRSRIVRVYDPENSNGHPVIFNGSELPGSVFMGNQIDTLTTDQNGGSHGTHTASIAAGTHVNGYGGMAPAADIVMATSRSLNTGMSTTQVANCIKYIYSYADSVGMPCVISMSVSNSFSSHDGNDYLSRAIKRYTGPGRAFVISAGNNANSIKNAEGPATKTKPLNFLINSSTTGPTTDYGYYYPEVRTDIWVRDHDAKPCLRFHILDRQTSRIVWQSEPITDKLYIYPSEFSDYFQPDYSVGGLAYMYALIFISGYSNRMNIQTTFRNLKSKAYTVNPNGTIVSRYTIGISLTPTNVDSCYIDAWTVSGSTQFGRYTAPVYVVDSVTVDGDTIMSQVNGFYEIPRNYASINTHAVCDSVVSAGAYVGRNSFYSLHRDSVVVETFARVGNIYSASSYELEGYGPTGKALPTITAPGFDVIAAGSRYSYFKTNPNHRDLVMMSEGGYPWGVMTGTSMAAPTIAGIIAQWLQIKPDLSVSEIQDLIARTAIKDNFTNASRQFGPNGKIDALAGAVYLINNNPNFVLGDVNGDGSVTIKDVTYLIDYLLGGELLVFISPAGDLNQDGLITIKDVTALIDMLLDDLGGEASASF